MTTLTIQVPDKFNVIISDHPRIEKIASDFIEDYLTELYQDNKTKTELTGDLYDIELNNKLKTVLGI